MARICAQAGGDASDGALGISAARGGRHECRARWQRIDECHVGCGQRSAVGHLQRVRRLRARDGVLRTRARDPEGSTRIDGGK